MSRPEELVVTAYIDGTPTVLDVFDLQFSCNQHGDSHASFGILQAGTATDGDLMDALTRIEITDPDSFAWKWLGRIRQSGSRPWSGGQEFLYQCEGMQGACSDQIFLHTMKWPTGRNVGEILREAGGELCPDIFCETAGGGAEQRKTHERTQEFVFATAATVFNTVAALGDAQAPLIWEVYSGGGPNFPILTSKARPTAHAYYALMASGAVDAVPMIGGVEIDFEADVAVVRNRASIKYRKETTTEGWAIWTEGGAGSLIDSVIKDYGVDLNRQTLTNNKILRETVGSVLAQVGNPQNSGRQIVLPYPCTLLDLQLNPIPLWTLRPNFILQVPDFNAGNLSLNFGGNDFYIETTTWNENARTMTCGIGPVR